MATDNEVLKLVWEGKIPACFLLARNDLACKERVPSPFYILLPRISYLPLITEKIVHRFLQYSNVNRRLPSQSSGDSVSEIGVEPDPQDDVKSRRPSRSLQPIPPEHRVWFEYANQPLKWQYPIGLVFDLHANFADLPWVITVHFSDYPSNLLSPPVNESAVEAHFINMLKEADALKHHIHVMSDMRPEEHRQLWNSLLRNHFEEFWSVNKKLMNIQNKPSSTESDSNIDETDRTKSIKGFRHIPCRLYLKIETHQSGFIQKLIPSYRDDGSAVLLEDAIKILCPTISIKNSETLTSPNINSSGYVLLIHGIVVPNETPMQWLSEYFSYPDNFIHIVARSLSSLEKHKFPCLLGT